MEGLNWISVYVKQNFNLTGGWLARPEVDPKTPLAQRMRSIRRSVGEPDRDVLAERLGVSKSSLASYERGATAPDADVLAAYRRLFGVDLNWLVSGDGTMFSQSPDETRPHPILVGDSERLMRAIAAVEIGLSESGRSAPPEARAQLILAAYDLCADDSATTTAQIIRLVKS